jgi:hypothetical protein
MDGTILYTLGSVGGFQEFMYPLINKVGPPATPELAMAGGYHVTYNSIAGWVSGTYVQVANP